ncbi:hypothetical protein B296_00044591 [Ensete ventricosum]|uniref:Uncharacterized protein n=1 Tax=Ensete ventricosum TaxID=4639 RepID=A0A426Y919_ENSVE|nr:hypothetical protein B296_00044591 [Ensete ventricosum]
MYWYLVGPIHTAHIERYRAARENLVYSRFTVPVRIGIPSLSRYITIHGIEWYTQCVVPPGSERSTYRSVGGPVHIAWYKTLPLGFSILYHTIRYKREKKSPVDDRFRAVSAEGERKKREKKNLKFDAALRPC